MGSSPTTGGYFLNSNLNLSLNFKLLKLLRYSLFFSRFFIFFLRFLTLPDDQLAIIDRYLKSGRPAVTFRGGRPLFMGYWLLVTGGW